MAIAACVDSNPSDIHCGCYDTYDIKARIIATPDAFVGSTITLCIGTDCKEGIATAGNAPDSGDCGNESTLGCHWRMGPGGTVLIHMGSLFEYQTLRDGDTYRFKVERDGNVLRDFSRSVVYTNTGRCDMNPCVSAVLRIDPESPSGLTCTSRGCDNSTATVLLNIPAMKSQFKLTACWNDICDNEYMTNSPDSAQLDLGDPEDHSWAFYELRDGGARIRLLFFGEPGEAHNGDRYRIRVEGVGDPIQLDQPLDYQETWPNGSECDPVPCKHVLFEQ